MKKSENFMSEKGTRKRKRKKVKKNIRGEDWTRCMCFMEKKGRYCCMPRLDGIMYCGIHNPNQKRVPCPLDPTHTVRESELKAHLKKCPTFQKMRALKAKPYYSCDCNIGDKIEDEDKVDDKKERWKTVEDFEKWLSSQLDTMRTYFLKQKESAIRAYAKYLYIPEESGKYIGSVKAYEKNTSSTSVSTPSSHEHGGMYVKFSAERHRKQHEGIISLLREHESMINCFKKTTIIEFGAGRAGLSWALNSALNEEAKKKDETRRERFLLIDRDTISKKHEKYFLGAESSTRICMDIRHLNLRGVSELSSLNSSSSNRDVSSLSKHLCGAATDLSLRCLHNFDRERGHRTQAIAYALCCHGVCKWQEFVGRHYFMNLLKFDSQDFAKVAKTSGWMCGYGSMSFYPDIDMTTRLRYIALGRACKRLIDAGRILFLVRDMGMKHVELVPYCDRTLTPENLMLLAWGSSGGDDV